MLQGIKGKMQFLPEVRPVILLTGYSLFQDRIQGVDQKWIIGALGLVAAGDTVLVLLSQIFWKKFSRLPWPLILSCGILILSGWAVNFQGQKMLSGQEYREIADSKKKQMIKEILHEDQEWYRLEEQEGGTLEFADMNRIRDIRQNISSI